MSVDQSGHRQRLKKAERENGLLSFSPHEVIELMLYPVLPRRDVNELSHTISDSVGGVCGLTDADESVRRMIAGLTDHTLSALDAYRHAVKVYEKYAACEGRYLKTRGDMDTFASEIYKEGVRMLTLLSSGREVICVSDMPANGAEGYICNRVLAYDASYAFIVCSREMCPADNEIAALGEALKTIDAELLNTVTIR